MPNINSSSPELSHFVNDLLLNAKSSASKAENFIRTFQRKEPALCNTIKNVALGTLFALSLIFRALPTSIGFVMGLIFHDKVNSIVQDAKDTLNKSTPLQKAALITAGTAGLLFLPFIGGFITGAVAGAKAQEYLSK